ncbi:MAG: hypothetical protein MJ142_06495, partial [Clostridia bacterium]|nr:hypothetical protein [Clostridia bacterium]
MERIFRTHEIRNSHECDPVWRLTTPDAGGLGHTETVTVPGVWESHPCLRRYRGRGIYEQTVSCGGNVRFLFGGVSIRAKVFLDGRLLREHYGAYTGFEAIAARVQPGYHTLTVEADNRFDSQYTLDFPNDYYAYGGINRPVVMEQLGDLYISCCHITPRETEKGWIAAVDATVSNLCEQQRCAVLSVSVAEGSESKQIIIPAGETVSVAFSLECGQAKPWSPDSPVLYEARTVLSVDGEPADDLIDRIGFREIRVSGKQILLNNRPLRLRGFNRHEEYASFGSAVPLSAMIQDIQLMRDMGANCIRTCHYPNDPRFLDLCDETGMLVWEESHARALSEEQMRHPLFTEQILQATREMISQHFNHPSVFVWGILNECADDTDYGTACYRKVFDLIRQLDPNRPVTAAVLERPGGRVYDAMDIVSYNLYPGWYRSSAADEALRRKQAEIDSFGGLGKPVIISEIGAGAIYGYHDPLGESKWSEERQASILENQLTAVLSDSGITGVFLWQFADVRVSEDWFASRPRTFNNKGIVDEYRRPKLAWRTVKNIYTADRDA